MDFIITVLVTLAAFIAGADSHLEVGSPLDLDADLQILEAPRQERENLQMTINKQMFKRQSSEERLSKEERFQNIMHAVTNITPDLMKDTEGTAHFPANMPVDILDTEYKEQSSKRLLDIMQNHRGKYPVFTINLFRSLTGLLRIFPIT